MPIELTFAEIFVPQDFTIRNTPGLYGPANTCIHVWILKQIQKQTETERKGVKKIHVSCVRCHLSLVTCHIAHL